MATVDLTRRYRPAISAAAACLGLGAFGLLLRSLWLVALGSIAGLALTFYGASVKQKRSSGRHATVRARDSRAKRLVIAVMAYTAMGGLAVATGRTAAGVVGFVFATGALVWLAVNLRRR